eukprot:1135936-Amphidinium_carterae.2
MQLANVEQGAPCKTFYRCSVLPPYVTPVESSQNIQATSVCFNFERSSFAPGTSSISACHLMAGRTSTAP